ncbi:MAG: homocysteine S-methyltransferase family protein [Candidatus Marinimicrobia bacterium]|nr:homocysteine S-methyltransferase family protein [Candidatus Neomarinimicrobiota bacterium]
MSYGNVYTRLIDGAVVILDGGMGSEVLRRGVRWRQHGIEDAPGVIEEIHRDYLAAGADVITSHTFNLTRRNFVNFFRDREHMAEIGAAGLEDRAQELCGQAVDLARRAMRSAGKRESVALAGSISSLQHPFRPDLAPDGDACSAQHGEWAQVLAGFGVDIIFFEAMNNATELMAAVGAGVQTGLPVWVSLIPDRGGRLLSGESLREAGQAARSQGAAAVLLSMAPVERVTETLPAILNGGPAGAQAMIGKYDPPSWKPDFYPRFIGTEETSPRRYAEAARQWRQAGAAILGGSSGTTPEHIAALKEVLA